MFKSKWRKKYEEAFDNLVFWRNFYDKQIERIDNRENITVETLKIRERYLAQKIALDEIVTDMRRIGKS